MQEQKRSSASGGAFTEVVATMRSMQMLAIHENELENVTLLNTQASAALGAAVTLFTFGLGLIVEAVFQEVLTAEARLLALVGAPVCLLLGAAAVAAAVWWAKKRGVILERIRRETRPVPGLAGYTPLPSSPDVDTAGLSPVKAV